MLLEHDKWVENTMSELRCRENEASEAGTLMFNNGPAEQSAMTMTPRVSVDEKYVNWACNEMEID